MAMVTVHIEMAKVYASAANVATMIKTSVRTPTMSRAICGAPFAFILFQDTGSR